MFDDLIRTLESLDGMTVTVPAAARPDADGYIDRQCPATECEFLFKVHHEDWANIVRDEEVWCPFCGHSAPSEHWWTHRQIEKAKEAAFAEVKGRINDSMRRDAERFNRRQPRNSFISLTLQVDRKPREIVLPARATDPMQLKIACTKCECRYAVIGSAYFCPACGHNAAEHVFDQSLGTIRATLDHLEAVRGSIDNKDTAENAARLLVEGALQGAVSAFQRYAEALLSGHPNPPKARPNIFQNLADGSVLWQSAYGADFANHLTAGEMATLSRLFQQRHLLAHKEGLVDDAYIERTGDSTYRAGQRLVVRSGTVRELVALVQKLGNALAADAAPANRQLPGP